MKNYSGRKISKIRIIRKCNSPYKSSLKNRTAYLCKCSCGKDTIIRSDRITAFLNKRGIPLSCGCIFGKNVYPKDLSGKRIGKLKILKIIPLPKSIKNRNKVLYKCKCDCGKYVNRERWGLLRPGIDNISCGCVSRQVGKNHFRYRGYKDIPKCYFTSVKTSANKRKIKFDVSIESLWRLFLKQNKRCKLSNLLIGFGNKRGKVPTTASVDRIDSSKGYVNGNVQWLHKDINQMKWDLDEPNFIKYCKIIVNQNKK